MVDEDVLSICDLNVLTPNDDTLESTIFDDCVRGET